MVWGDQRGMGDDQQEFYVAQFFLDHPISDDVPEIDWCMQKEKQNLNSWWKVRMCETIITSTIFAEVAPPFVEIFEEPPIIYL